MFSWPDGCAGAISLTFDDGMGSQLLRAFPAMRERGIRGTFYLNPRGSEDDPRRDMPWRAFLEIWRPVAEAGNEIGNHSLRHPCSLNIDVERAWGEPGTNLQDWTIARMEADVLEAQRRIAEAFPSQTATSFAYPCYETAVGRGAGRTSYVPLVARHFAAGRARGELRGELANDPRRCDLHHLSSWAAERQPGALLIGLAEQAAALGRWGIFTFHGVDEGHLPVAAVDLVELLDHLARRRDAIWVAPVAEVASYIRRTVNL
ncbi:MAG TPA: polysaccharide deacetylase family protein [Roseiflexaceae bacterium]|nr:polysaccharide deacetylase family protein [Roseiflexaceae bacterium]